MLGRTFSQLNSSFSCSTNSDIDSVGSIFLTCIKDNSKVLSLPYSPLFCLEYMVGDKKILVYLKLSK